MPAQITQALAQVQRTTLAGDLAALLALMPDATLHDWQEQDLAVASILEILVAAVEGNGDSENVLLNAAQDLRETVEHDRERFEEAA
jgi:hypothetical protein